MSMIEVANKVDEIVDELIVSMEANQVESIFNRHKIGNKKERIQLLQKTMKVLDTSNTGEPLSLEDEYSDELNIFLQGTWRFLL